MDLEIIVLIVIAMVELILIPWAVWVTRSMFDLREQIKTNKTEDLAREKLEQVTDKLTADHIQKSNGLLEQISAELEDIRLALAEKGIKIKKR